MSFYGKQSRRLELLEPSFDNYYRLIRQRIWLHKNTKMLKTAVFIGFRSACFSYKIYSI